MSSQKPTEVDAGAVARELREQVSDLSMRLAVAMAHAKALQAQIDAAATSDEESR